MSLMIALALFHLHISYSLPQKLNPQMSAKAFSDRMIKRMEIGDELKTYSLKSNGLLYYTKKPYMESIQSKERFLETVNSSQRIFVVIYPEALNKLNREIGIELCPIEQGRVKSWNYVLISNQDIQKSIGKE